MPKSSSTDNKRPKTELDEKFLSVAGQVMKAHGITSDRAISIELGRNPDFINKVRRGFQSAPPDAWDTLLNRYPEARNITTTNVMAQGGGQAIGNNHGTVSQDIEHFKPKHQAGTPYYEWNNLLFVSAEAHDALKREIELLKGQLADKERIIQLLELSK